MRWTDIRRKSLRSHAIGAALLLGLAGITGDAAAQDRSYLGTSRLFSNDALGDGEDRWRTGSYSIGWVFGPSARGQGRTLRSAFGEVLEFRLRSEIIAPSNLARPSAADRPYAGLLEAGLHTHFTFGKRPPENRPGRLGGAGPIFGSAGIALVATGPSTGLARFQSRVHDAFEIGSPVSGPQLRDRLVPTLGASIGRSLQLPHAELRPFAGAQIGIEGFLRAGADLLVGPGSDGPATLFGRDAVTGHPMPIPNGLPGTRTSLTFLVGGDVTRVFDSLLLPSAGHLSPRRTRARLRLGAWVPLGRAGLFYGLTYLGPEFEAQGEGQLLGSLRIGARF